MALAYDYLMVSCGIKRFCYPRVSDVLLKATVLHKCQGDDDDNDDNNKANKI